jgi:hypothetical protein
MFWSSVFGVLQSQKRVVLALAAASLVLALGHHIPVTGFLFSGLTIDTQKQLLNIHIFSVGFSGWCLSWALFQVFGLIKQQSSSGSLTTIQMVNPFEIKIFAVTLVISSFEWFGLLSGTLPIFAQSAASTSQLLVGVTTGLAAVSILFLLGRWIESLTPGFGFWSLIALFNLYGFGSTLAFGVDFLMTAGISRNRAVFSLALLLVCILSAVFLVRARQETDPAGAPVAISILLLSSAFMPWLVSFVFVALEPMLPMFARHLPEFALQNFYAFVMVLVQILLVFILNWLFILRKSETVKFLKVPALLAVLLVASELNFLFGGLQWSRISMLTLLIVTWAACEILKAYRSYRGPIVVKA